MNRIDDLIADPDVYYDDQAVEGFIKYCENELTLTDGSDLKLLDSFKVWAEQIFGWYEFEENRVYVPYEDGYGGRYVTKIKRKRLINKQYLIVARGAAKSMYGSCLQNFFLNVDVTTTHQITTAPTMVKACDAGFFHGRIGGLKQLAGFVADELVADIAFVLKIQIERPFGHTGFLYDIRNRSLLHPFCRK